MKKLLILGGSSYIVPVIKTAQRLGVYVITCDYLPDNVAHKYSDQYCNVSVVDENAVLKIAIENNIDGIMSFACDPGVVTAAYVAEYLRLPFQASYVSARILQDKGRFRKFLEENNFNVPKSKSFSDKLEPYNCLDYFNWPVIVKPVDSAGSKGVSRVETPEELERAISVALDCSLDGRFIVEEFIEFDHFHSSTDLFIVNDKIEFITYSDHLFDDDAPNPYVPTAIILPSTMKISHQNYLTKEIQRLIDLLNLTTGIYNVETCVGMDGNPYIMEVSPRGGGCKIAELQELAYGVSFIENEVRKAVGMPILDIKPKTLEGAWCEMVIHTEPGRTGDFISLEIDEAIKENYIKLIDLTVKKGDKVLPFTGANMSLGNIFLKCASRKELECILNQKKQWLRIHLKQENKVCDLEFDVLENADLNTTNTIITQCDDAFVNPISKELNFEDLLKKISEFATIIIAKTHDVLIGYAAFYANNMTTRTAYLTLIGVKPAYQKKGIGKELLTKVEQISLSKGMLKLDLEVKKDNEYAITFYKSQGYEFFKDCSNSSIYMRKFL